MYLQYRSNKVRQQQSNINADMDQEQVQKSVSQGFFQK